MQGLGEFVLRRAIADATRWPQLYVSVNLSPVQVRDRAFANLLAAVLKETGFEPSRLVLEMTESVLIHNPDETRARLMELRALGVLLALDDFGSRLAARWAWGSSSRGWKRRSSACCCASRAAARCRATCLRAPVHAKTLTAC